MQFVKCTKTNGNDYAFAKLDSFSFGSPLQEHFNHLYFLEFFLELTIYNI